MRILVINRFSVKHIPYREYCPPEHDVYLLTSNGGLSADPVQRARELTGYADVVIVDKPIGSAEFEYHAHRMHQEHRFDAIVALAEADLFTAARLRHAWRLPGQTWDATVPYRDKLAMKHMLSAAGIPVAPFAPLDNVTDLLGFIDQAGYPVVVKPRRGASSIGVQVLQDQADLERFIGPGSPIAGDKPADMLVEQYVPNQMYNVDGLVSEGRVRLIWPSATTSCLGFQEVDSVLVATPLEPGEPWQQELVRLTTRVIEALPTEAETLFHAEVFRTEDGQLVFNEIGCRMGGGKIWEQFLVSFGVDVIATHLRRLFGSPEPVQLPRTAPSPQSGWCLLPPRPGVVASVPGECPIPDVVACTTTTAVGATLAAPVSSIDSIGSIVVQGPDRRSVDETLAAAIDWFYRELKLE